jgi:uncharacterized damage-inducible protein DinB
MAHDLLAAWDANHAVHLLLLDATSDEGMKATTSTRGGRDVARQFAHLHNVRVAWMENRAKDLAAGLATFATDDSPSKDRLRAALAASHAAVAAWLTRGIEAGEKAKSPGPCRSLAYFVAHESHHRGNVLLTLKLAGHAVDRDTQYAIWGVWTARGDAHRGPGGGERPARSARTRGPTREAGRAAARPRKRAKPRGRGSSGNPPE